MCIRMTDEEIARVEGAFEVSAEQQPEAYPCGTCNHGMFRHRFSITMFSFYRCRDCECGMYDHAAEDDPTP